MPKGDNTTTATTSTSLPSYIQPYMEDFLAKAKTAANLPYTANPNQQVAGITGDTNAANSMIEQQAQAGVPSALTGAINTAAGIAGSPSAGVTNAMGMLQGIAGAPSSDTTNALDTIRGMTGNTPAGVTNAMNTLQGISGYTPQSIAGADLSGYMSPYTQQVLDVQKAQATRDYQQQQGARDTAAVNAGAFGGDRATIANSMAQQDLNTNLQGIEATGLNNAYNNATSLFQNDQANQLQAKQLGISAAGTLGNLAQNQSGQQLSAATSLGNLAQNQSGLQVSAAGTLGNLAQNSDALRLNAANTQGSLAQNASTLGLQQAAALSGVGAAQQQQQQNELNATNAQWTAQNQYPITQADLYSKLLNGTYQPQTSTSTTTPAPSLLSQLVGLAGAGVGAYKAFTP